MIIYPAIDLKDGACVRLLRGEMDQATVFNTDAGAQARLFEQQGFEWLHVVDLNGAFAGQPVNGAAVDRIMASVDMPVQLGGGIRTMETVDYWLGKGIRRVILGTIALRDPDFVRRACERHPGRVAVGIDARGGYVAVEGWAETSTVTVEELALKFEDCGVAAIIHTDVDRDGLLGGVNVEATVALAEAISTPVIASGGVGSLADLETLKAREASGLDGVIVGRALYDGRVDPARALEILA
ncbi:1-(5-phosphoribosyl)-5-[(5-phosphoribosylamino)methylideneamino]imidazole-4-carboxamide isomerase [Radicibacter daui]|uniref:1-(5-phosphoribosyl)-5-[(5- phosphoribosylamino)methylideneamino]imidazole-4- carboxamide isomerase n=1 Tax=Radicibacter daui TaxID=3064829 RepID=UPI004046E185